MKTDQEFEDVRRLLKLKRHEKPPPRYFNDFSGQVIARLRAGVSDDRDELAEGVEWQNSWSQRLLRLFQSKPVFAGGFGAAVCLMLVAGVTLLENLDHQSPAMAAEKAVPDSTGSLPAFARGNSAFAATPSINPVAGTATNSIFDMLNNPVVTRVSWTPGSK
jgi:hypothetical protein